MLTIHLLALLLGTPTPAQSTKAELFGTVTDGSGLTLSGATVQLWNLATGAEATVTSDHGGKYHFVALPPATYRLSIAKAGFSTLNREGIGLRVGDRVSLDVKLQLGDVQQTVEVTAAAPLLQTTRGTASFVVDQRKIVTLPLDGRNYVPLIALSPGVNLPPGNLLPRINGSRPRVSEYIYDGVSVLQPEPGQVAYYPIVDAIEEFRVETNSYSAEYGRSNGGVIMVNQKSGSNNWRGTLFEFFRNEKLNARNLFATTGAKPQFRRNQYGFLLSGPVRRNKTFFLIDWQGTRLAQGAVRTSTLPTAAQKQGQFATPIFDPSTTQRTATGFTRSAFPGNTIPASRFDKATLAVLDRYPAPTVSGAANNFVRIGNDITAQDQFDTRIDHQFNPRHRLFTRYAFLRDSSVPTPPLPDGSGNLTTAIIGDTLTRADSLAAEHTWTLSAAAVNQLRFGYTRRGFHRQSLRTGRPATDFVPGLPLSSFSGVLPVYDVVGFQQLGPPASGNSEFTTSVTQFIDNFSWVRGSHSLKAGTDIRRQRLDVLQPPNPAGNFQFSNIFTAGLSPAGTVVANTGNSVASFLLGQVTRFSIDAQPSVLGPRASIAEFFLQDDWRVTLRLSLNVGVRYTLNLPSTVVNDQGAVFNLVTQKLDFLGRNGFPRSARDLETANFAPRVGLAFKITNSLVMRSGYGLTWIEQAGITTPFTTPLFPFIQTLTQQTQDNINPAFQLSAGPSVRLQAPNPDSGLGQGVFAVQRNNGSGYAQQWNWMLQKTLGGNWSIEAGYLGSKLTRLGVPDVNLNQLTVEQLVRNELTRPYPRFNTVTLYRNNIGHSTFHSFQSRAERRFARGLTFMVNYTFARLIDDAGAVFDSAILTGPVANFQAADSFNKRLEKDVSTGNVPHIFSGGFVYELPFSGKWSRGWQLAGIVRAQSGSPIAVTQATNLNAFAGFGIQRPNRIAQTALPASEQSVRHWFNTGAFSAAPQGTIGTSSRNPVTGPGYRTLDLMIGRTFQFTERVQAECRAEAFNSLNTPPLSNPNGSFGAAAFGTISTSLDPRVFELVVKLRF